MKQVFADTSYYVALLSEGDEFHDLAVEWSESHLGSIFLTEYVLVELGSSMSHRQHRLTYVPFVKHVLADSDTRFIPASTTLFTEALDLFASRPDKDWSLVDCASFVVMKRHRIREALTADHHFQQAGFLPLLR